MIKTEILDAIKLHRIFNAAALEKWGGFSHDDMQAAVAELTEKGLLVKISETKYKYIEKSELFNEIYEILQGEYAAEDISEEETELLAWELELDADSGDINCIPDAVADFRKRLKLSRERGVGVDDIEFDDCELDELYEIDAESVNGWEIYYAVIDILEVNEKNARALYQSFSDFNDYNLFVRLVTDFREYFTKSELEDIFDTASLYEKSLVDCYRD